MAYSNKWNSTDQMPQRAIARARSALSARKTRPTAATPTASRCRRASPATDDAGSWKANAYVVKSQLDLFNNFTYFLSDPVLGDQFHQHDDRVMAGANASRTLNGSFARPADADHLRRADAL